MTGNALWVLTPGRSTEFVDFSADTLRDAKIWDRVRPRLQLAFGRILMLVRRCASPKVD